MINMLRVYVFDASDATWRRLVVVSTTIAPHDHRLEVTTDGRGSLWVNRGGNCVARWQVGSWEVTADARIGSFWSLPGYTNAAWTEFCAEVEAALPGVDLRDFGPPSKLIVLAPNSPETAEVVPLPLLVDGRVLNRLAEHPRPWSHRPGHLPSSVHVDDGSGRVIAANVPADVAHVLLAIGRALGTSTRLRLDVEPCRWPDCDTDEVPCSRVSCASIHRSLAREAAAVAPKDPRPGIPVHGSFPNRFNREDGSDG